MDQQFDSLVIVLQGPAKIEHFEIVLKPCLLFFSSLCKLQTSFQYHNLKNHTFTLDVLIVKEWLSWGISVKLIMIIEPVHEISNNVECGTSKASDQPAHTRSLIRAFASRLSIIWL